MSRTTLLALAAAAVVVTSAAAWLAGGGSFFDNADDSAPMICSGGQCCCRRGKLVAGGADASGNRLTLDPDQFVGPVKDAYQFAGKNPGLISQLWCYCGCDKTDGHRSWCDLRDLHRRSITGQANVRAGFAGRPDSRGDSPALRNRGIIASFRRAIS